MSWNCLGYRVSSKLILCIIVKEVSCTCPSDLVSTNGGVPYLHEAFSCMFART